MSSFSRIVFSKTTFRLLVFSLVVGAINWSILSLRANRSSSQPNQLSQSVGSISSTQQPAPQKDLVNLVGTISRVEEKAGVPQLNLQATSEALPIVKVARQTVVMRQGKTVPFGNAAVEFQKGQLVQIIGHQLRDGSVIATKVIFVDS